ncbi:MAG: septal ring lytic transglycosylase RlpA family protein [Myxococcota bacterium]|nr:septal ring lytic transglycosylase RlpA family protein [Myxococcota bacterium]
MNRLAPAILTAALLFGAGCVRATTATREEEERATGGALAVGKVSFYGEWFRGKLTASGEKFNPDALTAAHPRLKFGSCLVVENTENGRRVQVRVNDRGPYVKGRILDVSLGAARVLGMVDSGVVRARLWRCDKPR